MNKEGIIEFFKSNGVMITLVLLCVIIFYFMSKKEHMKESSVTFDQEYDVQNSTIDTR